MKIALIGDQVKFELFTLLTKSKNFSVAKAVIEDEDLEYIAKVYSSKKITYSELELMADSELGTKLKEEGKKANVFLLALDSFDPKRVKEINENFIVEDMAVLEKREKKLEDLIRKGRKEYKEEKEEVHVLLDKLNKGIPLRTVEIKNREIFRGYQLLSLKPLIVVFNVEEEVKLPENKDNIFYFAYPVKFEYELMELPEEERENFRKDFEIKPKSLEELKHLCIQALGLINVYTAGEKEARSWLIERGSSIIDFAASIHSDLARGFIKAEVFNIEVLKKYGSPKEVKSHGELKLVAKDYIVNPKDIIYIRFKV